MLHDDSHDLKTSMIGELRSQTQEMNSANRIINYRYEMSSILVVMLKHSVEPNK
jgi:hypothetical protein